MTRLTTIELIKALSFIDGRVRYRDGLKEDKELYEQIDKIMDVLMLELDIEDEELS